MIEVARCSLCRAELVAGETVHLVWRTEPFWLCGKCARRWPTLINLVERLGGPDPADSDDEYCEECVRQGLIPFADDDDEDPPVPGITDHSG